MRDTIRCKTNRMLALPSKSGESAPSDEALIERIAARHFRGWRRLLGAAPGVLLAVALAAQARVRRAVHTVVIDGVQFIPAVLEVGAGGTVARVEHDPFPQAAIADREGVDSGNLPPELAGPPFRSGAVSILARARCARR